MSPSNNKATILVVSDDHGMEGFKNAFKYATKQYGKIDHVIHAGDIEHHDNGYYEETCGCPFHVVRGNNDYNENPENLLIEIAGKKIFVSHGHRYGVYMGAQNFAYAAMEKGADIAVFGHTHHAFYAEADGLYVVNPGSLTLPRGARDGSFAMIFIENDNVKVVHITANW